MNRPAVTLSASALLAAGLLAACSGHAESAIEPTSTDSPDAAGSSTSTPKPAASVGDTLTLNRADGGTVAVTVEEIISPATVTPGPGDPGVTYIATKLKITDPGTVDIDGDVNINVSVTGSDGQKHVPDLKNVSECTNFDSGIFHLNPGESATGCVVFALPHGVSPTKLTYEPSSGFAEDVGEWMLPSRWRPTIGHNYIGTEHLLLALLDCEDDTGPLHRAGVDRDTAESDLAQALESITTSRAGEVTDPGD